MGDEGGWGSDSERWNMRAIGPDFGLTGTTDNRGTPRNPTELHGTSRNIKKVRLRTQIHLFFRAFPAFSPSRFLLPSPPHPPTPAVATHGRCFETTDMLGDARWRGTGGDRPRMVEYASHRTGHWGDWHNGQPRNPTESHGTLKRSDYAPESAFFPRVPHFRLLVFFSPLLHPQHLLLRQMEGVSKPPTF